MPQPHPPSSSWQHLWSISFLLLLSNNCKLGPYSSPSFLKISCPSLQANTSQGLSLQQHILILPVAYPARLELGSSFQLTQVQRGQGVDLGLEISEARDRRGGSTSCEWVEGRGGVWEQARLPDPSPISAQKRYSWICFITQELC